MATISHDKHLGLAKTLKTIATHVEVNKKYKMHDSTRGGCWNQYTLLIKSLLYASLLLHHCRECSRPTMFNLPYLLQMKVVHLILSSYFLFVISLLRLSLFYLLQLLIFVEINLTGKIGESSKTDDVRVFILNWMNENIKAGQVSLYCPKVICSELQQKINIVKN